LSAFARGRLGSWRPAIVSDGQQNTLAASDRAQQRTIACITGEMWRISPRTWSHLLSWCNESFDDYGRGEFASFANGRIPMGCVRPIYSPELVAEAKRQARNFPKGITHVETLVALVEDPQSSLPGSVCVILKLLVDTFTALEAQIAALDAEINQRSKSDPTARRLTTIPRKTSAKSRARCRISSQAGVKELRVRRLAGGGGWIRTCMGFPCQVVFFGLLPVLCSERKGRSSSRRLRSGSGSARNGVKGPKRWQSLAACRLAALVFGSALTPEHAAGR
jgi:hypothetical protein